MPPPGTVSRALSEAAPGLPPGSRVGVACSGGLDSMVLLDLATGWAGTGGWDLAVLHVDHGLRPEAAADAAFVARAARSLGLPLCLRRLRMTARATGLEAAARAGRYAALAEMALEHDLAYVLLAHHRDDQLESVLMRILRGSGPRGLRGMPATRRLAGRCRLVRPLLDHGRDALVDRARARALAWREDASNEDRRFLRNRLRHDVLPRLGVAGGSRLARIATEAERLHVDLVAWASRVSPTLVRDRAEGLAVLDVEVLARLPRPLWWVLLRDLVADLAHGAPGHALIDGLAELLRGGAVTRTLPGPLEAVLQGRRLWLLADGAEAPRAPLGPERHVPLPALGGHIAIRRVHGVNVARALALARERPALEVLAAGSGHGPLEVRPLAPGERYRPLGAPGRQRVTRLWRAAGLPAALRKRLFVVADDEGPVWVPGARPAERRRVRPETKTAVILEWESPPRFPESAEDQW